MPAGYGTIYVSGKIRATHRVAWETWRGEIPFGVMVLHSCDNPPCINPDHLFLGSRSDNALDSVVKGRWNRPLKLTEDQVLAIRASSQTNRSLAAKYGVAHSLISMIRTGKRWRHLE